MFRLALHWGKNHDLQAVKGNYFNNVCENMALPKWCVVFRFRWRDSHVRDYRLPITLAWKKSWALGRLIALRTTCYTRRARPVSSPEIIVSSTVEHARTHGRTFKIVAQCTRTRISRERNYRELRFYSLPPPPFPYRPPSALYFFLSIYFCRDA